MKIPGRLQSVLPISYLKSWLNDLRDAVANGLVTGDEKTTRVSNTGSGYTVSAIRGGGGIGGGGGDAYSGYFLPSVSGTTLTVSAGKVVVGPTVIDTASTDLTIAANAWIYVEVTYSSGYLASVKQAASYPAPVAGTWKRVIANAVYNSGTVTATRQQAGPVHYEG